MLVVDNLGPRIRSAREALGLRQEELAETVRVSVTTVKNWESGRTSPRDRIGAIERALHITLRPHETAHRGPLLDDASDAQVLGSIAARLAARDATIAELRAELDAIRGGTVTHLPARYAARRNDNHRSNGDARGDQ